MQIYPYQQYCCVLQAVVPAGCVALKLLAEFEFAQPETRQLSALLLLKLMHGSGLTVSTVSTTL